MGPIEVGTAVTHVNGRYEGKPMVVGAIDGAVALVVDGNEDGSKNRSGKNSVT